METVVIAGMPTGAIPTLTEGSTVTVDTAGTIDPAIDTGATIGVKAK